MNPYPIIAAVILFLAGLATGWKVNNDHRDALLLAEEKATMDALNAAADAIARIKVVQKNTTQVLEKELRTNTVYQDCKQTPEAMKVLNDALTQGAKK